jgi:tetratricopeptide (TPR) repeat protein
MRFPVIFLAVVLMGSAARVHAQAGTDTTLLRQTQREAIRLDGDGKYVEARAIWQRLIDAAPDPAARAAGQRQMAMSYGFESDCANTAKYEQLVIEYWKTRETAEPQNAFYQQGEMANEAARVCIDAGDLDQAEGLYRLGYELGNKEPAPRTHPQSLWDFRLAHALGRLAARRGDKNEAGLQVGAARRMLDSDSAMARAQGRFFPYLVGYVALYTGDLATAEKSLAGALTLRGNERDPFLHCLLGMTYEQMGQGEQARALYQKAYDLATGHNPPAAFARPFARRKLASG